MPCFSGSQFLALGTDRGGPFKIEVPPETLGMFSNLRSWHLPRQNVASNRRTLGAYPEL